MHKVDLRKIVKAESRDKRKRRFSAWICRGASYFIQKKLNGINYLIGKREGNSGKTGNSTNICQ